jgi:hypothetical protein
LADTDVPASQGVQGYDRYAYSNNNPVRYTDPTGHWIESAVDIAFIAYDIYDISQNGLNWENGLSLAADVAGLALPFVTGGGLLVRAATHADDVVKAVNTVDNVIDTANAIDNAIDAGNAADNLTDMVKLGDDLPDDALVCCGGMCKAEQFANGSGVTMNPDGTLSNVSVNSQPGATLDELTTTIPNGQVGVTTVGDIRATGGSVVPDPLPNNPYHANMSGITPQQAELLFTPTIPNPNRFRPR